MPDFTLWIPDSITGQVELGFRIAIVSRNPGFLDSNSGFRWVLITFHEEIREINISVSWEELCGSTSASTANNILTTILNLTQQFQKLLKSAQFCFNVIFISYRPKKWRQNVQNSGGITSRKRVHRFYCNCKEHLKIDDRQDALEAIFWAQCMWKNLEVNKREWHGKQEIKAKIRYASHINRGYYMVARGYKISLRVYISRVSQANEWNIFSTWEEKFRTSKRPCNVLSII